MTEAEMLARIAELEAEVAGLERRIEWGAGVLMTGRVADAEKDLLSSVHSRVVILDAVESARFHLTGSRERPRTVAERLTDLDSLRTFNA